MTTIQQRKDLFNLVSNAKNNGKKWSEICKEVNNKRVLGKVYSASGIRQIFSSVKKNNNVAPLANINSFKIAEEIESLRRAGLKWDEVATEMVKWGVINTKTQNSYTGAGIQAVFEKLTGTKRCPRNYFEEKTESLKKAECVVIEESSLNLGTIAKQIHFGVDQLIKSMAKLHEYLDADKKKNQEHDDEVLRAMLVLEKLPSLRTLDDLKLEKLNAIATMLNG